MSLTIKFRKNDKKVAALVNDITQTLVAGKRYTISEFGTFSTCARKATAERAACKIAMFRASTELRDYACGEAEPVINDPHQSVIREIVKGLLNEGGVDIPGLGHMAVVPVKGKPPKLIFHGDKTLNDLLTNT